MDDVVAMERHFMSSYERRARFASVVDSRRVKVPPSPVRRELAQMSNRLMVHSKTYSVCSTTIIDSKVLLGALTAVRWLLPNNQLFSYQSTAVSALGFVTQQLAAEGLSVPASAHAFAAKLDAVSVVDDIAPLFP